MKMLFVCSAKSNTIGRFAGTHRILQLERNCRKLGAKTSLLFLGDFFFSSPVLIQPLNLPFVLRYLKGFDVVYAGGSSAAYFLAIAKPLIGSSTLVVYDEHSDPISESRLIRKGNLDLAGYFDAFQMRLTEYVALVDMTHFIAASQGVRQRLLGRKRSIKAEDVEVILNGVDLETFRPQIESKYSVHDDHFTVTYAGSFNKYQGINNLIKAAELLRSEDVHFKFIGFRANELNIKNEIRKRIGERAILSDWLPKTELLAEIRGSDVLIIPADASNPEQSENRAVAFPTKFAEFLALGKPVIVTRIDETSSIVERFDCGFVCQPTAESIADAILKAKGTSQEVLIQKGLNGRRFAEAELDINLICKKYLQFLDRIVKERARIKVK